MFTRIAIRIHRSPQVLLLLALYSPLITHLPAGAGHYIVQNEHLQNGYGVPDKLPIVLEFQPTDAVPTHHCFLAQPEAYPKTFAFFTLQRESSQPDRWQAYYNGFPVDDTFPKS